MAIITSESVILDFNGFHNVYGIFQQANGRVTNFGLKLSRLMFTFGM